MSWFRLAACCPPYICVEVLISCLRSVWGSRWRGECFAPCQKHQGKAKKHIKVRKRVAFCAPASCRGQLLCQFFAFTFHQVLKLESIHNHCFWWLEPSGTFLDWFWSNLGNFIFHHVWHVRGHFQKVFWEGPKAIFFCFASKLVCDQLQCFSNMSSELECDLDHFFMSWFRLACVVPQICVEASIFYLRSVWGSRGEESASHHVKTPRKTKKHIEVRNRVAFCAPASYRGQILCQLCQILCLSNYIKFTSLQPNQKHCSWWPEAPRDLSWIDPGHI